MARRIDLNQGWLFGGRFADGAQEPGYDDSGFTPVTLPHTVVPLSWGNWDPAAWQHRWIYRRHFRSPAAGGGRVFADFDGVMTNATVVLNGTVIDTHEGGYLGWSSELTAALVPGDNVLAVIVDARWLDVPPDGRQAGAIAVDYLQPGGIYRDVSLRVEPQVFVADVFARPVSVLTADRSVAVQVTIDAAVVPDAPVRVAATLLDGSRALGSASATVPVTTTGITTAHLAITEVGDVTLWSPDSPRLYKVAAELTAGPGLSHRHEVRTGFREASFELDGFYLNGERLQIFGLNRHQLFPYAGMAAGARLQRRDAEILKHELNCNMVRCSHYPQSPHFLDACDELGLMVWQEPPGWGYVGGTEFQDIVLRNVRDMVIRDRSRPSVIVWATRLNETASVVELYRRTRQLAAELDPSRQTSGALNSYSLDGWAQDLYGHDDYRSAGGDAALRPPLPEVPYLVTEAVGALTGPPLYRWTDSGTALAAQGRLHAQVHDQARADPRYAGVLGWCAIDYASLNGGDRIWQHLKTPGVLDTFRVPKPGAAFYRSQLSPAVRPVILPMFFWDFGPSSPGAGPGPGSMIATNCERLELSVDGQKLAPCFPDVTGFPNLPYPPVLADLTVDGSGLPELRIDGFVGDVLAATVRMSADTSGDRLELTADHDELLADGTDATRVTFRAVDAYGNQRPYVAGTVALTLTGPATLIGDNPFPFAEYGGVGGAFIRSRPGQAGPATVQAEHATLGRSAVRLMVRPVPGHDQVSDTQGEGA